ncbi:MAG: hypothetical protein ACFE9S_07585 [Candidatus Hermodarchaeota archaeon]
MYIIQYLMEVDGYLTKAIEHGKGILKNQFQNIESPFCGFVDTYRHRMED